MTEQEAKAIFEDGLRIKEQIPHLAQAYEVAIKALERQIAKKPVGLRKNICPSCSWIVTYKCDSYCPRCGQRILWEDSEV